MSELTPQLAPRVVAACQSNADEIAGALSRILDAELSVAVGEAADYSADSPIEGWDGPGLLVLMRFGDAAMAAVLPESSGVVPIWCQAPDPTGESKLITLAQELGKLLVPETLLAEQFSAQHVPSLSEALARGKPADGSKYAEVKLAAAEPIGALTLVWPLSNPGAAFPQPKPAEAPNEDVPSPPESDAPNDQSASTSGVKLGRRLPEYARSLLKVSIPLNVRLASRKEGIGEIVEMAPGTIIRFEKACDDLVQLYAGDRPLAEGEAVKVGEKFGFRVTSMLLPDETFHAVRPDS